MNLNITMSKGKFFPKSCTICGVHFNSARHFTVHSQRKNICRPKPYTCRKCGKVFNYYWNLIAHEKRKIPCGLRISKVDKIVSKVQTESFDPVQGYIYQEKAITTDVALLKKMASLTCRKCGESFRSHSSYYRHRKKCPLNKLQSDVQMKVYSYKPKTETSFTLTESFETRDYTSLNNNEHFEKLPKPTGKQNCNFPNVCESASKTSDLHNRTFSEQAPLSSNKPYSQSENEKSGSRKSANAKFEKGKYEFTCEVCGYLCFNAYTWCRHMKKHKFNKIPKGFLRCPVCKETFCTPYILFRHQRKLKHWRKVQKLTSEQYSNDEEALHNKQVENTVDDRLDSGSGSFVNNSDNGHGEVNRKPMSNERLLSMKLRDIKKKKWDKIRIKKINKAITVQSNKGTKKYPDKCPVCGRFVTVVSACQHFQNKSEHLPLACKWCSRRFKHFREMCRHQQVKHRDLLPFECMRCEQRFPKRSCTLHHISQLHKDVPKHTLVKERFISGKLSCQDEGHSSEQKCKPLADKYLHAKKLPTSQVFLNSKTPDNEKRGPIYGNDSLTYCFMCSVCNQVFDNVTGYVAHSLNHFNSSQIDPSEISESKPYECEICKQKFTHHQRVQTHFLWHLKMIKSPFPESGNNSNITFSLYNNKDSVHSKARFQIAKKSIFSKASFGSNLTENRFHGCDMYSETPCNKCSYINCQCQVNCSPHRICLSLENYCPRTNDKDDQKSETMNCNKILTKKCIQHNSHIELHNYCQAHNSERETCAEQPAIYNEVKEVCNSQEQGKEYGLQIAKTNCHTATNNLANDNASDNSNKEAIDVNSAEGNDECNEENFHYDHNMTTSTEKSHSSYIHVNCENQKEDPHHYTEDEFETMKKEQVRKNYSRAGKLNCNLDSSCNTLSEIASENILSTENDSVISDSADLPKNQSILRSNFSELLYLLIGDPELMQVLGWGEKEIDVILEEVLSLLGQTPVEAKVKLEKLRRNISLLLQVCIKDSVVSELKNDSSSVDDVVFNILQLCKSGLDNWNELSIFHK